MNYRITALSSAIAVLSLVVLGCGKSGDSGSAAGGSTESISIRIDGSSTVFPIVSAAVEEFSKANTGAQIPVGNAGTGAGMAKFVANEIDICNASRPIEQEEIDKAAASKTEFIELPIAFDGLSIVVNPKNTYATTLTVAELKKIWEPESKVKTWADVRAGFPATPIKRYGPSTAHGTFEYFTEAIVGKKKQQTTDFQQCSDYNALIQGVQNDEGAIGYVGYAYYVQNKEKLNLVSVDAGKGAIAPSEATIADGTYAPLSRPLLLYVNKSALDNAGTKKFVDFLLNEGLEVVSASGYIKLPEEDYAAVRAHVEGKITGSVFSSAKPGAKISDLLKEYAAKK